MKKLKSCVVENCIPTPTSCNEWNGGDIEYLGICNGDSLNVLVWELVSKLQELAGEDLSEFDIDSLLDICNQKAPNEINIISILTLLKNNQICLKDFLDGINDKLNELFQNTGVVVNLKCYAEFDNQGNSLTITRESLDQLVINALCNQKDRIETIEGKLVTIQAEINDLNNNSTVEELNFATCVDAGVKPTSSQVIGLATAHCNLQTALGSPSDIASALSKSPSDLNTEFGAITGWDLTPVNLAEYLGNMILEMENLRQRIAFMEDNCCASTCEDVKLGFSAVFNEDNDGIIISFTYGAGTVIPSGFTDKGSNGYVEDEDGNKQSFNLTIANNSTHEVSITGLSLSGNLTINITAILGTDALTCQKCLNKVVATTGCKYCELTATGDGEVSIIYEADVNYSHGDGGGVFISTTSTTTSGS